MNKAVCLVISFLAISFNDISAMKRKDEGIIKNDQRPVRRRLLEDFNAVEVKDVSVCLENQKKHIMITRSMKRKLDQI